MPLVLSIREGEDFYVADHQFMVKRIYDVTSFTLVRQTEPRQEFEITADEAKEVCPDVYVSAGDLFQRGLVRVAIDAPRSLEILRGERYREKRP